MNLRDFGLSRFDQNRAVNIAEFCQSVTRAHASRLSEQQISLDCDIAADLKYELPVSLVRRILDAWIVEAMNMMPRGGQVDITVVRTPDGLEIEVADSREADLHETHDYWHRQIQITDGAVVDASSGVALLVEATRCPQGGIARTVVVPNQVATSNPELTSDWRKVA